jgi:hypothetical protein
VKVFALNVGSGKQWSGSRSLFHSFAFSLAQDREDLSFLPPEPTSEHRISLDVRGHEKIGSSMLEASSALEAYGHIVQAVLEFLITPLP